MSNNENNTRISYNVPNYYSINPEDYPVEYFTLNRAAGVAILDLMNKYDEISRSYYDKFQKETDTDKREQYFNMYEHYESKLSAYKGAYEVIGIRVERWSNDPERPWLLATRKDAEYYNNHLDDEDDVVPQRSDSSYNFWSDRYEPTSLWPSPEGDKYTKAHEKTRYYVPQEKLLTKEGDYWYDSSTGYYYDESGKVVMHDAILRN